MKRNLQNSFGYVVPLFFCGALLAGLSLGSRAGVAQDCVVQKEGKYAGECKNEFDGCTGGYAPAGETGWCITQFDEGKFTCGCFKKGKAVVPEHSSSTEGPNIDIGIGIGIGGGHDHQRHEHDGDRHEHGGDHGGKDHGGKDNKHEGGGDEDKGKATDHGNNGKGDKGDKGENGKGDKGDKGGQGDDSQPQPQPQLY